jgi:hypothetical protein
VVALRWKFGGCDGHFVLQIRGIISLYSVNNQEKTE